MPTLSEFNAQLERCAQSAEEIKDFIEAFSKVRLRYIAKAIEARDFLRVAQPTYPTQGTTFPILPDWTNNEKLTQSGLTPDKVAGVADPAALWLHIDIAMDSNSRPAVASYLARTCLSDKQRRALFPFLSAAKFSTAEARSGRRNEVSRLNAFLD